MPLKGVCECHVILKCDNECDALITTQDLQTKNASHYQSHIFKVSSFSYQDFQQLLTTLKINRILTFLQEIHPIGLNLVNFIKKQEAMEKFVFPDNMSIHI